LNVYEILYTYLINKSTNLQRMNRLNLHFIKTVIKVVI